MRITILKYLLLSVIFIFISFESASAREWVDTNTWLGEGQTVTRFFSVLGDRCRLHYLNHGPGALRIQVFNREHEEVYEIYTRRNVPGIRTIPMAGDYYLKVEPENARWEVTVRQRLSQGELWRLRQQVLEFRQSQEKIASFSGESGRFTYPLSVAGDSWRIVYSNNREGNLRIRVRETGTSDYLFDRSLDSPTRTDTWVHDAGEFELQVEAGETRWRVDIYQVDQTEEQP